jgi:predicted kinase
MNPYRSLRPSAIMTRRTKPMGTSAKLVFFCGKMAAGKSTLARELANRNNTVLLVQDDFLNALFPGEITDIPGFIKCSSRLKNALTPHVCILLSKGISVVLDFPGNTKAQREWFRELIERTNVEHELHFLDASDDLCKTQLRNRSKGLPEGTAWTSESDFEAINAHFQAPLNEEKFNVVRHQRD